MRRPRVVVVLLAGCVSILLVGAGVVLGPGAPERPPSGREATVGAVPAARVSSVLPRADRPREVRAAAVLRAWDKGRSRAYASGDVEGLARLYAPRSGAGRADVRLLRSYLDRGLRVTGLRVQVLSLQVLSHHRHRWTLRVTDRVAGGVAVGGGRRWSLPRDRASTSRVVLRRGAGGWRVAAVLASSGR